MKRRPQLNGTNAIVDAVERSLNEYFDRLDGEPARNVYDMVIDRVEKAMLGCVMQRVDGNQTQAADLLGMNRNTLRAKLSKYKML
jgi:Fis family transcriptional regulator